MEKTDERTDLEKILEMYDQEHCESAHSSGSVCLHVPVARLTTVECGEKINVPRCANSLAFLERCIASPVVTCAACGRRGNTVPASKCWKVGPL